MARRARYGPAGPRKAVVVNRQMADELALGYADGLHAVGLRILERARPTVPDREPIGRGLVTTGSVVTFVNRKRVAEAGPLTRLRSDGVPPRGGVATVVGYGFPGLLVELGTGHSAPEPFVSPAFGGELGDAASVVAGKIRQHLARVRGNATNG